MTLYIDLGNTRLKWMLSDNTQRAIVWRDDRQLAGLLYKWQKKLINNVVWVSTASDEINTRLTTFFDAHKIPAKQFTSLFKHPHIKTAYDKQQQLGADRWLALLAAYQNNNKSYCVISAGTAITVDFVHKNQHYPSIIIPGERLMRESLQQKTSHVDTTVELLMNTPKSTQQCVQLGIQTSICSAIEQIIKYYQLLFNQPIEIIITGGDANWLKQQITAASTVDETLLIKGLKIAFP